MRAQAINREGDSRERQTGRESERESSTIHETVDRSGTGRFAAVLPLTNDAISSDRTSATERARSKAKVSFFYIFPFSQVTQKSYTCWLIAKKLWKLYKSDEQLNPILGLMA